MISRLDSPNPKTVRRIIDDSIPLYRPFKPMERKDKLLEKKQQTP